MPEDKRLKDSNQEGVTRREAIASATLVPLAALTATAQTPAASTAASATFLTGAQRRTLEAILDRLVPRDENGPGAVDMGAADYIDRSLAEYLTGEKAAFGTGLARTDEFARASQGGVFADLSPEKRDAVLTAMEAGKASGFADAQGFFNRVRRLTLEGMFGDPHYGGNKNFAGWDLIKYPGVRMASSPNDQKMSAPASIVRKSAWEGDGHGH